jgi:hypothetical protein
MACRFTLAASVLCAREIGYWTTSDLIFDQALSPERICALFRSSISRTTRRDVAFIILCGSIARYRAATKGWSGESEDALARSLVGDDFARLSDVSASFVSRCWPQIEALVRGACNFRARWWQFSAQRL